MILTLDEDLFTGRVSGGTVQAERRVCGDEFVAARLIRRDGLQGSVGLGLRARAAVCGDDR